MQNKLKEIKKSIQAKKLDGLGKEMELGIRDEIIEKIKEIAQEDKSIKKIYIFGSRAKGTYKSKSDIDIAVEFYDGFDEEDFLRLYNAIQEINTLYKFDIINLNEDLEEKFKNNILEEGKVIYEY